MTTQVSNKVHSRFLNSLKFVYKNCSVSVPDQAGVFNNLAYVPSMVVL